MENNYQIHDLLYQDLRASGAEGWGGTSYSSRMNAWSNTIKELIEGNIFPPPPSYLLEVGAGAGDISIMLAQQGYSVTGIEISQTAVNWAQQKANDLGLNIQFLNGNACDLKQLEDYSFDAVVDGNCLHCIIGNDRQLLLSEVYRVLNKDGIFYVSTMIGDPKNIQSGSEFDFESRCLIQNGVPYRYMGNKNEILDELKKAGFEVLLANVSINSWWDHLSCLARKKI